MVIYLVCFDLSATPEEQREQLFYWLQFLNSSISSDSTNESNNKNSSTTATFPATAIATVTTTATTTSYTTSSSTVTNNDNKNWRVILVGLKSDLKKQTTFTTNTIQNLQSQVPNIPLFHNELFEVSSLHSQKSVDKLLKSVSQVCDQIFKEH